ncbi:hypothetical protein BDY17DRAFT_326850 [Neohortaea acidophila]|uniref:Uncharacterized protein n=1 Tax=Neohortaea acidophila TaxID=245834 RepID=A0A6A6PJF6_9PEZI|nr:uncharacterized protein BDY17DRAFT_326850 [Neohortaea acidophila]KAF2479841.1 hypothetical protein BDY17DRAFT_326850 [Neohortaea acidophila]
MARERGFRAAEKENLPPKKVKRTISVSTLFTPSKISNRVHKSDRRLAAPGLNLSVTVSRSQSLLASRKTGPGKEISRSFNAATDSYRKGVALQKSHLLEPVYAELIARVDITTVDEDAASVEALANEEADMSRSLDDEIMVLQTTLPNGKTVTNEVRLGDTVHAFEKLLQEKRQEMTTILEELHQVEVDMATAKQEILVSDAAAEQLAREELDASLAELKKEILAAKETTRKEFELARKEDQDEKRKFEAALKTLMEDV